MTAADSTGKRPYRMRARAEAQAATNERILDSAEAIFEREPGNEPSLKAVAERAGVTVQTVIRHFGNRRTLFVATLARLASRMHSDRDRAPIGDVKGAIGILVDHYEDYGDRILLLLASEDRHALLGTIADVGRAYHQEWCEQVFAPGLAGLRGAKRERRVAQLVAVTDIYFWKLLRRDRDLSLPQAKLAMQELLEPLIKGNPS